MTFEVAALLRLTRAKGTEFGWRRQLEASGLPHGICCAGDGRGTQEVRGCTCHGVVKLQDAGMILLMEEILHHLG